MSTDTVHVYDFMTRMRWKTASGQAIAVLLSPPREYIMSTSDQPSAASSPVVNLGACNHRPVDPDLVAGEREALALLGLLKDLHGSAYRGAYLHPGDPQRLHVKRGLERWRKEAIDQVISLRRSLEAYCDAVTCGRDGDPYKLQTAGVPTVLLEPEWESALAFLLDRADAALFMMQEDSEVVDGAAPVFCDRLESALQDVLDPLGMRIKQEFAASRERRRDKLEMMILHGEALRQADAAEQPELSSLNMAAAEPPAEPPPANGAPERAIGGEPDAATLPHQAVAQTPRLETPLKTPPRPPLKEPSKAAMAVYRYWFGSNCVLSEHKTQTELANDLVLMKQLGRKVHQATISRYLKQVRKWMEAGNIVPETSESLNSQPKPMDPERIDLGKRQDGRTERQRGRRNTDE
jgi:hypothetical protein